MPKISIYRPSFDSEVRQLGYFTPSTGNRVRNAAYDACLETQSWNCTSVKTPGFRNMKKGSRYRPINPFNCLSVIRKDSSGTIRRKGPSAVVWEGVGRKVMGTSWGAITNNLYGPDASHNFFSKAETGALNKMLDMKFNAAQAFAERKQTADLLVKSVNRFVTFAVLFRKGNFKEANKILRSTRGAFTGRQLPTFPKKPITKDTFANSWLEYSYGWRPLLNDIYGSAELLADTYEDIRQPCRVRGGNSESKSWVSRMTAEGLTGTARGKSKIRTTVNLEFDIGNDVAKTLAKTGITNPALLAWELLPYSFVIDWFIPIGNYLSAVNATTGLVFKRGSRTTVASGEVSSSTVSDGSIYSTDPFPASAEWCEVIRIVYNTFPTPHLPSVSLGLNLNQVTSGLSLISQFFKK